MDSNSTSRFSGKFLSCASFLPQLIWALCGRSSSSDLSLLDQGDASSSQQSDSIQSHKYLDQGVKSSSKQSDSIQTYKYLDQGVASSSQQSESIQTYKYLDQGDASSSQQSDGIQTYKYLDQGVASSYQKSDSIETYKYDVFISFRGPDTRNKFVDHLYNHLVKKGIFTFKDDEALQQGKSISPQLLQAIQHSRVSIIVFSENYAYSTWCLDEMAAIYDCHCKQEHTVFPVFLDIDPSHVKNYNGVYEKAFVSHSKDLINELLKVNRWQGAMYNLARLAGWDVRNKSEFEEIEKIVQAVIKALGHKFSGFANDLIGIQPRVKALERLLNLNSKEDGFQVLGIWGMGGIGKTTLATALYDTISHHYQFGACCFIENVSKIYRDGGAIAVQKQILFRTIKEKNLDTYDPSEISGITRNRLCTIKLLIVLDDVDNFEQLQKLHIDPKSLCTGSRIIITTRDEHILKEYGADTIYEVKLMEDGDARDLLCKKAFKSDYSSNNFAELIPEVLKYAQGLPLVVTVMGSLLCTRNVAQWRATLNGLQNTPPDNRIMNVLQISFEALQLNEKEIFLHVACFFKGERHDYVRRILDACGLNPDIGIPLIAEKSLITIRNQVIYMHEMLQELGKQIVQGQHLEEPRFWSRLWCYKDFRRVMRNEMNALGVKAIVLDKEEDDIKKMSVEKLSKMENLKLLILCQNNFSGSLVSLSDNLCYFSWDSYPFTSLPSDFEPFDLVELNMPNSSIENLWTGIQHLPNLKRMNLSNSKNLKMTPCFDGILNLERLDLTGCTNLLQVHPSIGLLTKLVFLSLLNCSSLIRLDFEGVSSLSLLRVLRLSGCIKLQNSPDLTRALNLEYLDMDRCTRLSTIHESIGALAHLKFLSLRYCTNLVGIPDSLNNMTSLVTLDLCGCFNFTNVSLNSTPILLIYLDLSSCYINELPDAIGELRFLERLDLQGNKFTRLPSSIKKLDHLAYLNLSHCHSLEYFPELPTENGPSDSVGRYFKTTSESRDHRSGLYIFDCPKLCTSADFHFGWLQRLAKEPRHFRCGFDIVLPRSEYDITEWFEDRFNGGSTIRVDSSSHIDRVCFVFCVVFEVNNRHVVSGSQQGQFSSSLPHPFYLSFESERTEELFDFPLNLKLNMVDGLNYVWTIYISGEHCHFTKTGANVTFKFCKLIHVKEWGLRMLHTEDMEYRSFADLGNSTYRKVNIKEVRESSRSFEPKIQLPYNWRFSDDDEVENDEAKGKEISLSNLGL